jgi:hypothetical protein
MSGPFPSTEGNAVPNVDGSELGDLMDDLRGIHPGIDLMLDGARLICRDRHTRSMTQVLLATIAGSPDALDLVGLLGHLVARLADADTNPGLRSLPLDAQKEARHQGWLTAHHLTDPDLRDTTAHANAALDTREEVHAVTDTERKELSKKVADANKRSSNRPH